MYTTAHGLSFDVAAAASPRAEACLKVPGARRRISADLQAMNTCQAGVLNCAVEDPKPQTQARGHNAAGAASCHFGKCAWAQAVHGRFAWPQIVQWKTTRCKRKTRHGATRSKWNLEVLVCTILRLQHVCMKNAAFLDERAASSLPIDEKVVAGHNRAWTGQE